MFLNIRTEEKPMEAYCDIEQSIYKCIDLYDYRLLCLDWTHASTRQHVCETKCTVICTAKYDNAVLVVVLKVN